ncbi:MAG: polysulfide reductase NrfD [candidate division Zixibacteria bacterium]|nr:polysulfide reductase NrfD [candidate division Zixibacteria bacterium]
MSNPFFKNHFFRPFNIITGIIIFVGIPLVFLRFTKGLGTVSNLSHYNPWGSWVGIDILTGVALSAGGYVTAAMVEIFGLKKYRHAFRPAILAGFLGYALVVTALIIEVGRPWRLLFPFFVSSGLTSIKFEVAVCVSLYLIILSLEFLPVALEWLRLAKLRYYFLKIMPLLTIMGVLLSTLHQSSLGALLLIAPSKLHPLWYSSFIPLFFFISSIAAGLSVVILLCALPFEKIISKSTYLLSTSINDITIGFGRAAAWILAIYLIIKLSGVIIDGELALLITPYGGWFLLEIIGFVLFPCFIYIYGVYKKKLLIIRLAALMTIVGIFLNRVNSSIIALNWHLLIELRYIPNWMEIGTTIFLMTVGAIIFRFIITRMPVFFEHEDFKQEH